MDRKMMTPRPLMVALALTSVIGFFTYLAAWILRKPEKGKPRFGQEMRDEEFLIGDEISPCNHGSYGTVPSQVLRTREKFAKETEHCPDEFMRMKSPIYYEEGLLSIADMVGANMEHLVFVENTTAGINTVLKAMTLKKGDSVLITNLTYRAIKNTAIDVCDNAELDTKVVTLDITFPIQKKEQVIQQYRDILENNTSIKVAIIDHITSSTALIMPIKELIVVCQSRGVEVIIDGAHAPGQLQLNLEELGADYYIGNLHKWLFTPRGCALLWIHQKHYKAIKPLVTSHCYQQSLLNQFFMQGTRDSTPYFCTPAAIGFYEEIGGFEEITKYNRELLEWAMELLKNSWKTESLPIPDSMRAPFMGLVALPLTSKTPSMNTDQRGLRHLMDKIYEKYQVVTVIVHVDDRLWCRLCANVYNTRKDYMKLRDAVLDML